MEMATHSSILAWRIPWTGEPGGLLSMGSRRVIHDMNACIGEGNGNPLQYSRLENSRHRGAWWAAVGCRLWGLTESDMTDDLAAAAAYVC